jgi:hypothetical protein
MKSRPTLLLAAALSTLMLLAACKKPNEPSSPTNPEPKASEQAGQPVDQGPGTTTNFENPPAATEPAKPAQ